MKQYSAILDVAENSVRKGPFLTLLWPIFRKYAKRLLLGFGALVGVDFLQLIIPRLLKTAVDALSEGTANNKTLITISCLIISAAIGAALLRFCWRYLIIGFSRLLERDIRNRIYAHVLKMDQPFFEKRTIGDIMAHISNDLQAIQMACGIGLVSAIDALVMSVAAISFMVYINPKLTLLALLPMPFLAICTRVLTGRLHHRFNAVQEQFSLMTEFVRSTLVSMRLVKAYTMENLQKNRFGKLGEEYVRGNIRVAVIHGLLFPVAALVGNLGMLLVLYYGGTFAIKGTITMGDFVAFITYLYMLVWPMMAIGWVANLTQRGMTSLKRIESLISVEPQIQDIRIDQVIPRTDTSFMFKNLSFTYQSATHPALQDLNLELEKGLYGITGRTGSGKTTLCKLLARLYPVADGSLYFGDSDVNSLPLDIIRDQIAYVGQEAVLFSDTISANIAFGEPDATREQIESAARRASIHEEINDFQDGYDTVIGERGVTLSGGQRQRLALARALVTNRPVLIIDDALAALDVETEHEVLQAIIHQQSRKIVIIVSQRVKLLSEADTIFVLHKGRLQDKGTHAELLQCNELYMTMNEKQARESGNSLLA